MGLGVGRSWFMFCAFVVAGAGFSVQGAAVKRAVEALMYFQSKLYGASSDFGG